MRGKENTGKYCMMIRNNSSLKKLPHIRCYISTKNALYSSRGKDMEITDAFMSAV